MKRRFITGDVPFIQSAYIDNLYLDTEEYTKSLDELTKQQLKYGDWDTVINKELLLNLEQFNNYLINMDEFKTKRCVINGIYKIVRW